METNEQTNIPIVIFDYEYIGYNQLLAHIHRTILPKVGSVIILLPYWKCFPTVYDQHNNLTDKIISLSTKWSDCFYNKRPNNDFKNANLWTKFIFNDIEKSIVVIVEPIHTNNDFIEPSNDLTETNKTITYNDEYMSEPIEFESEEDNETEYYDDKIDNSNLLYSQPNCIMYLTQTIYGPMYLPYVYNFESQNYVPFIYM